MADNIETNPALPQPDRGPHERYLNSLIAALIRIFVPMANRLNLTFLRDGSEPMEAPLMLAHYMVSSRPDPSDWEGGIIYVSDAGAGLEFQGSDGTSWLYLY